MNKEFKRLQELAGIKEIQVSPPKTYYAVINHRQINHRHEPFHIITHSKELMINTLNKAYKELTGENYIPYRLDDLDEEARGYYETYISDDWATVTDDKTEFNYQMGLYNPPPKRYQSPTGVNEIVTRGNTQIYKSIPDQGLYKVKNFPVVNPQDILSNPYFIKILNKILKDSYDESLVQYMEDYTDDDKEYIIKQITSYISELKSLQTVYVYPDGGGEISIYDSLEHFSEGYKTEEDWEVEGWEQI
jgi:hypothetical protein